MSPRERGRDQAAARIRRRPGFHYLQGLGTVDDRMIILLDIEKLMSSRDMELIETAEEIAA